MYRPEGWEKHSMDKIDKLRMEILNLTCKKLEALKLTLRLEGVISKDIFKKKAGK